MERRRNPTETFQDAFQILHGINTAVVESGESHDILTALLNAAVRLFEVNGCSLALLDEESGGLEFNVHTGEARLSKFFVPAGRGFAGWVIKAGKPVLCNEPARDPRFFGHIDTRTGFETNSLMCAPVRFKAKVMGVIQVLNTQKAEGFSEADLRLLTSFGELAGMAIDSNATLQEADHANSLYREESEQRYAMVWGESSAMKTVMATARKVAPSAATVLLMSESGTGKEVTAHAIHRWSRRAHAPFVAVNCVALTPELLGSELFGHEKGAFTGATNRKIGKFEMANKGTIFLDEIGELTLELQAKLLRVLQERDFQRVGGTVDIHTDVRIIAATNRDLRHAVQKGQFREDLFYRLNVITLELPPLRRRRKDIPALIRHFLERCSRESGRACPHISDDALELLCTYDWPGNVRQLRNTIERAIVLTSGPIITTESLPREIAGDPKLSSLDQVLIRERRTGPGTIAEDLPLAEAVALFKRQRVLRALAVHDGNQSRAAKRLGMQPSNLSRLLSKMRSSETPTPP